jgi:hypothetical protein
VPNWRPETATDPDGPDAWRFRPLLDEDRELALRLIDVYASRWVERSGYPESKIPEVSGTMELVIADEWTAPGATTRRLRMTSWFTGSTYYLPGWNGDWYEAKRWIEDVAEMQAGNVDSYRGRNGPTPWDDSESEAWKKRVARWE